ncbi:hypothetical protein [Photorhabdus caribbeanensis]|uniref:hypothetical protein n=1 Tax=Photorhabdus caribbeanensis TaxID=1004165 RepID=UPI001BD324DA|nr:hypothetical protein [Photorhabdus caribbeanensis]
MHNYFQIKGYGVNKHGLIVSISYQVISSTREHALQKAQPDGFTHIRLNVQEVTT